MRKKTICFSKAPDSCSDSFDGTKVETKSTDGLTLTMSTATDRKHFYFGTDPSGRDLLTRTLVAGRVSLAIGVLAGFVALVIGVIYGATAGLIGGKTDEIMMRVVDILYALPFTFFVIMLVVFFGRDFVLMFIAVGAVLWLDMARIVRGQTLSIRRQEYVQAAEALGISKIVCFTETGNTVRLISRYRPSAEVFALSPHAHTVNHMTVLAHVRPLLFRRERSLEDMLSLASEMLVVRGMAQYGDPIIFVAGVPAGKARTTNVMKVHRIGEEVKMH